MNTGDSAACDLRKKRCRILFGAENAASVKGNSILKKAKMGLTWYAFSAVTLKKWWMRNWWLCFQPSKRLTGRTLLPLNSLKGPERISIFS
jgi:hypothetical protein